MEQEREVYELAAAHNVVPALYKKMITVRQMDQPAVKISLGNCPKPGSRSAKFETLRAEAKKRIEQHLLKKRPAKALGISTEPRSKGEEDFFGISPSRRGVITPFVDML